MGKRELIRTILEKKGFSPEIDKDGDLKFFYQLKLLYVIAGQEDEKYVSIMYHRIHEVEEGQESLYLALCNKMTRDFKMIKLFLDPSYENVTATCEFFYLNEDDLVHSLDRALEMLSVVRSLFKTELAELSKE